MMLFIHNQILLVRNQFQYLKRESLFPIAIKCTLQVIIAMLVSSKHGNMMSTPFIEIDSASDVSVKRDRADNEVNTRIFGHVGVKHLAKPPYRLNLVPYVSVTARGLRQSLFARVNYSLARRHRYYIILPALNKHSSHIFYSAQSPWNARYAR